MLLQPSLHNQNVSLSSSLCYTPPLPCKVSTSAVRQIVSFRALSIGCSVSKVYSDGTQDQELRRFVRWTDVYRKICLMKNPELGSASVLNQVENEGKAFKKWELCRVVIELRKFKKHDRALEVYEWMNNREERFRLSARDCAIQLDLISKVRGVSSAEEYFLKLPDKLKGRRIYGALLNAYVREKMKEKAESLLDTIKSKDYATHPLPFNGMMTLYMNLKEYDKVDSIVSEMKKKNVQLDIYSYNIWLSSCGSQGSSEKMEQVFEQMLKDKSIIPNWTIFSTLAAMYVKMDMLDKAEESLRKVESRISCRNRIPYHYLLSLYGRVGKKEDVYRVWNTYKSIFPTIPNLSYHVIISSLVIIGDIEGAEKLYEEWLSVKSSHDARIGNLLLSWLVKNGNMDKAQDFLKQMYEVGGKPNSRTWEILAEGHVKEKRISEALSCFKEAFTDEPSKRWKAKPVIVSAFFKLCQYENDTASSEALIDLLRRSGQYNDKVYASLIGVSDLADDDNNNENTDDGSQILLNQLEDSL